MLILTRRIGEAIIIGDNVFKILVLDNYGKHVRIGLEGPREIMIHREEVYKRILAERSI